MTDPYPWEQRGPCPCPTCTEDRLAGKRALEAAEAERDALRDAARTHLEACAAAERHAHTAMGDEAADRERDAADQALWAALAGTQDDRPEGHHALNCGVYRLVSCDCMPAPSVPNPGATP